MKEEDFKHLVAEGIPETLPEPKKRDSSVAHAPKRNIEDVLTDEEKKLAVSNALRYFPEKFHPTLAKEFAGELRKYGRVYMYRFRPDYAMYARPINAYPACTKTAAAIMLMIQNNLDPTVAKYPHELITYGGNGAVFQNWAQYRLVMKYLAEMTQEQTLVLYSGHPLGLFPSHVKAPRVVLTNGMMIPNYSSVEDWNKYNALGVTQYGQMTAGSFMYIGPQGIVHGTTITLLNAARRSKKGIDKLNGMSFISSGLGGMSGAQTIAAEVCGAVGIIAEIDPNAIRQRLTDGYIVKENIFNSIPELIDKMNACLESETGIALVYAGNVVELWEYCAEHEINIDLGSDQTSLHNIQDLGYAPVGYSYEEAEALLKSDKEKFMHEVRNSLKKHVNAINKLTERGMYFWDYGNAFLKEAAESNADIFDKNSKSGFRYSSYVEDIMGPICFDHGFGPFRWVCASGDVKDLEISDQIAAKCIKRLMKNAEGLVLSQLQDNLKWIENAGTQIPKVGSMSRILYADGEGRIAIARAFNKAIADGRLSAPVVLGRDHHDVSGTDSPYRETSDIYDGSQFTADMSVQNVIGDSFRGASWVSLHNGGGVGWGEVMNGGFGMMIDGSERADDAIKMMLYWDVYNGVARRSWAKNNGAVSTINKAMKNEPRLNITLARDVNNDLLENLF